MMSLLYPNYAEVGTGSVGHYRNVPLAIKTVFILFFHSVVFIQEFLIVMYLVGNQHNYNFVIDMLLSLTSKS